MKTCLKLLISDTNFVSNRNNCYSITYECKMKDTEFLKPLANILKIGQEMILKNCKQDIQLRAIGNNRMRFKYPSRVDCEQIIHGMLRWTQLI